MRRDALVSSALFLAMQMACTPPKKSDSSGNGEPDPEPDTGQINVDTTPEEEQVDESKKVTDNEVVDTTPKIQMTGTLAIDGAGLDTVAKPDKVLAFPIQEGKLKSVHEIITAPIDASGKFAIKLPKFDPTATALKACFKADGSFDREKFKDFLKNFHTGGDAAEMLKESDENLKTMIQEELDKALSKNVTYVLVSMVSSSNADSMAKRAEEAATFAFVGLSAGGHSLINIPVGAAKKDLDLGTVPIDGDDARSPVDATSGDRFELAGDVISQLAATGATLKAVKNDYVNTDPVTGLGFRSSPFFAFEGDLLTLGADSFTTLDIGYKLAVPLGAHVGYSGYGIYMSGKAKDPSNPTADLMTKNLCGDDLRLFELLAPADVQSAKGSTFNATNPMTNANAEPFDVINNNTRVQCSDPQPGNDLYYASGDVRADEGIAAGDDKHLNWNWGSGGSLLGNVPSGVWKLEIEGTEVAQFDLASARPLSPASMIDFVANVFVPQIKVTKDGAGLITNVEVKFAYYQNGFKDVKNLIALRRGVQELSLEFDDHSGTRESNRVRLDELEAVDGVFSVDPATGDSPAPFKFPANPALPNADRVAESIAVSYTMYGNTYRFDFRIR